eukprot:tig00000630_g2687.t1
MPPVKRDKNVFRNEWQVDMCDTCTTVPGEWCRRSGASGPSPLHALSYEACFACFCPCCAAYDHRVRALDGNMNNYRCCAGLCACCGDCHSCTKSCPECCLACEVACCFSCAVSGNRLLIQGKYMLQNTPCDNCILWTSCICSWVACIVSIFVDGSVAQLISCAADLQYCAVQACMQAQHGTELAVREGKRPPLKQPVAVVMAPMVAQPAVAVPMGQPVSMAPPPPQPMYGQPAGYPPAGYPAGYPPAGPAAGYPQGYPAQPYGANPMAAPGPQRI